MATTKKDSFFYPQEWQRIRLKAQGAAIGITTASTVILLFNDHHTTILEWIAFLVATPIAGFCIGYPFHMFTMYVKKCWMAASVGIGEPRIYDASEE